LRWTVFVCVRVSGTVFVGETFAGVVATGATAGVAGTAGATGVPPVPVSADAVGTATAVRISARVAPRLMVLTGLRLSFVGLRG
jgi:hypothetical protein